MNISQVARQMSKELNVGISESRIRRYADMVTVKRIKDRDRNISDKDMAKIKVIVLLTELGIGRSVISKYLSGSNGGIKEYIRDRVKVVKEFTNLVSCFID